MAECALSVRFVATSNLYTIHTHTNKLTLMQIQIQRELYKCKNKAAIIVQVPLLMRYLTPRNSTQLPCGVHDVIVLLFLCVLLLLLLLLLL